MEKNLLTCTVAEFIEALRQGLGLAVTGDEDAFTSDAPKKHFVYGLKGLAQLLGCSRATAARIKKSGILNAAICQSGKIIVIDADLAIDLLQTQSKRRKR